MFFGFAHSASAATYYVSPTGSNTSPYDTWAKAANLPSTAVTAGNTNVGGVGPHVVYIAPGTYISSLSISNNAWVNGSIIGTSAIGVTSSASKGQVIINAPGTTALYVSRSGITVSNIALTVSGDGRGINLDTGGNNFTGNNLWVYDANISLAYLNNATNFSFTNCLFTGSASVSVLNAIGTSSFNYCIFTNSTSDSGGANGGVANGSVSGTLNINNSMILGARAYPFTSGNAGATTNIYNSIIGASSLAAIQDLYITSGIVNAYNNILLDSWGSSHQLIYGTLATDLNNVRHSFSGITSHARMGYLVPRIDDIANLSYAQLVESKLSPYGYKGQYYVGSSAIASKLSALQTLINNGVISVGTHGWTEGYITITGTIFSVTKAGATINIDRTADTITITPGGTVSGFKEKTLDAIRLELVALGCTNGTIQGSLSGGSLGEAFADSSGAQASPYNIQVLIDTTGNTGLFKTEMKDALALGNSLLTGYSAHFAFPGGGTSADIETALKNVGFLSGSEVGSSYPILSSYNVYKTQSVSGTTLEVAKTATGMANNGSGLIRVTTAANTFSTGDTVTISGTVGTTEANGTWQINVIDSTHFDLIGSNFVNAWVSGGYASDDTQLAGNARGLAEAIVQDGLFVQLLAHNTSELTAHEWDVCLSVWSLYPQLSITDMNTVTNALHNSPWSTADDITYTRSWTDVSNYYPLSSSPVINAGTNIGLTTDYAGNSIVGAPDIGAYEYLPSTKAITAFNFASLTPAVTGTINGTVISLTVPYGTPVAALVATFTTTGSSVAVGATPQVSGTTANDFTSPVTYIVTAADSTTQNYSVTVTIAANIDATLSGLTISSGTLSPTFASGTISYTDSVAYGVTSLTVTPTVNQANATVKVNNVTVTSGQASGSINLNVGANTITTVVTAQDGSTTDTYTITVTRAAATTCPAVANASTYNSYPTCGPATCASGYTLSGSACVATDGVGGAAGVPWFYITVSAGENGKITPVSSSFPYGSAQTFAITPNSGYQISDVLVDNVSIGTQASYTFNYLNGSHAISATFENILTEPVVDLTNPVFIQKEIQRLQAEIQRLQALIQGILAQRSTNKIVFTKDLKLGDTDPEVKLLQKYLNTHGFVLTESGPGSPGNETTMFGYLTRQAVIKLQEKYVSEILAPLGLTKGTGIVAGYTRAWLNK